MSMMYRNKNFVVPKNVRKSSYKSTVNFISDHNERSDERISELFDDNAIDEVIPDDHPSLGQSKSCLCPVHNLSVEGEDWNTSKKEIIKGLTPDVGWKDDGTVVAIEDLLDLVGSFNRFKVTNLVECLSKEWENRKVASNFLSDEEMEIVSQLLNNTKTV